MKRLVRDIYAKPEYFSVAFTPSAEFEHPKKRGTRLLPTFLKAQDISILEKDGESAENLVMYEGGDSARLTSADQARQFLLVSGEPAYESVAWRGPIVMNTEEELARAFEEYRNCTFVKQSKPRFGKTC